MPDNDGGGPRIRQHFRRNIARKRSPRLGMTILPANRDGGAARYLRKHREQCRRRADQQIGLARDATRSGNDLAKFGRGLTQAVHFPIARNQRAARRIYHVAPPPSG